MTGDTWQKQLRQNVARVRAAIAAACARRDRSPRDIRLVGVTKYVSRAVLRELVAAGVSDIGESRPQQLAARAEEVGAARLDWPTAGGASPASSQPRWHLIGHLQRNKIRLVLPHARIIHALDSVRLAEALARHAAQLSVVVDVFIEVNVAGEDAKQGIAPEELTELAGVVARCDPLRLRGLMTMAPYDPDPEAARPHFIRLRELLAELQGSTHAGPYCRDLSMGMSQDYIVAIEEGATFIRVGSALFAGIPTEDPRQE